MIYLRSLIPLFLSILHFGLSAQELQDPGTYKPHAGQDGKDVIWIPTPEAQVETMLDLAKVTSADIVIDLGSGDGRTVIAAAKRGATSIGIEYNQNMVELSRKNAVKEGVSDRAEFIQGDLFEADLSKATVITMFLLPEINIKLRPSLLELKPGTRIVSNSFHMDEWIADSTVRTEENCKFWCDAFLWIVPAKISGTWQMTDGELLLGQKFQRISGKMKIGKRTIKISEGILNGNNISFMAKKEKYSGIVIGNSMEGTVISPKKNSKWSATQPEIN
jgi:precorrin-6B methylase 2